MHLLIYDGDCALCSRVVQFVLARDRHARFRFARLQGPVGRGCAERAGLDPDDRSTVLVIPASASPRARVLARSDAVLFVASQIGWPWPLCGAARVVPRRLRDWLYDLVARHRHRAFGAGERCLVPTPDERARFLDGP